jgi:dTDP-4-dehydrorhamnose reductase
MAKVTIEFNLDNADDKREYYINHKAEDMAMFIWELSHNTKKSIGYDIEGSSKFSKYDTLDLVFDKIHEMLQEYDINVDKLG